MTTTQTADRERADVTAEDKANIVLKNDAEVAAWIFGYTYTGQGETVVVQERVMNTLTEVVTAIRADQRKSDAEMVREAYNEWYERIVGGTGNLPVHMTDVEALIARIESGE